MEGREIPNNKITKVKILAEFLTVRVKTIRNKQQRESKFPVAVYERESSFCISLNTVRQCLRVISCRESCCFVTGGVSMLPVLLT
jgi:hypothetical protein